MMNKKGQNMDPYIPRKCSATNRIITAKHHASVQLNIGHIDERHIYWISPLLPLAGDADSAYDRL
ncbi:hypothetical protein MKW92_033019 [Papaver armeniacum]|nr:hypothetical protein MKW92_033019 [Papaver armeniacum]